MHHGYQGELDNLYRYNDSLPKDISKVEKLVYFSSIIFKLDLGYYFTRWCFSFDGGNTIFDEKSVSTTYTNLMKEAINKKLIDSKAEKKNFGILIRINILLKIQEMDVMQIKQNMMCKLQQ